MKTNRINTGKRMAIINVMALAVIVTILNAGYRKSERCAFKRGDCSNTEIISNEQASHPLSSDSMELDADKDSQLGLDGDHYFILGRSCVSNI